MDGEVDCERSVACSLSAHSMVSAPVQNRDGTCVARTAPTHDERGLTAQNEVVEVCHTSSIAVTGR